MAEEDTSWHAVPGYPIDAIDTALELYRLLCIFDSSHAIAEMRDDSDSCPYTEIIDTFEKDEITRILLAVAVRLRILDDHYKVRLAAAYGTFDAVTGKLALRQGDSEKALSLRDACNKIIHAKLMNFDKQLHDGPGEIKSLLPHIYLYDRIDKSGWRADLDIHKFVTSGSLLCKAMFM